MGNNFGNIVNLIFALIGAIIVVGISIKVIINIFSNKKLYFQIPTYNIHNYPV